MCSYKEDSDDQTDSDDLIEVALEQQEGEVEEDNKEIIEKVLDDRIGRSSGTEKPGKFYVQKCGILLQL